MPWGFINNYSTTSHHFCGKSHHFSPLRYNITPYPPQNQGFEANCAKKRRKVFSLTLRLFYKKYIIFTLLWWIVVDYPPFSLIFSVLISRSRSRSTILLPLWRQVPLTPDNWYAGWEADQFLSSRSKIFPHRIPVNIEETPLRWTFCAWNKSYVW